MNTSNAHLASPKVGESLLMRRIKLFKHYVEPMQINNLFQTICKSRHKFCKVIMDEGSTENLVSQEMARKLGLQRLKHPTLCGISWFQDDHVGNIKKV